MKIMSLLVGLSFCLSTQLLAQSPHGELTDKTRSDWAKFIRPSKKELSYEAIGWRSKFWPAVEEAQKLGRPILLWTMNGHPLGCT